MANGVAGGGRAVRCSLRACAVCRCVKKDGGDVALTACESVWQQLWEEPTSVCLAGLTSHLSPHAVWKAGTSPSSPSSLQSLLYRRPHSLAACEGASLSHVWFVSRPAQTTNTANACEVSFNCGWIWISSFWVYLNYLSRGQSSRRHRAVHTARSAHTISCWWVLCRCLGIRDDGVAERPEMLELGW